MTENYFVLLMLGFALGGAFYAYLTQRGRGVLVLLGLPVCVVMTHLLLPLTLPWSMQVGLLLGYLTLVQLWWCDTPTLTLTATELTEIGNALGTDVFALDSVQVTTDRVVCRGRFKTDRYSYIQQKLQERLDATFPAQFHVVLCQELFQPPSCCLLPVGQSPPLVLGLSRLLAVVGAVLLTQQDGIYILGLLTILGAREWTRARIGGKLRPLPLLTMPGIPSFPIVGMGRGFRIPPTDRRMYFWLGFAPAAVGLGLSLLFLAVGWLGAEAGQPVLQTWLGKSLGVRFSPLGQAGWDGLMITALGLLPIGWLEGGHLLHSLLGYSKTIVIGRISRVLFFALSFSHYHVLLFAALLLCLMDVDRLPALNDLDELPESYDLAAIGMLGLGLFLLFPGVD
jgi:hypothetical protein